VCRSTVSHDVGRKGVCMRVFEDGYLASEMGAPIRVFSGLLGGGLRAYVCVDLVL